MWDLIEALFDLVTSFGNDDDDRRDRRNRRRGWAGCGFAVLVVILFVAVFVIVFNL